MARNGRRNGLLLWACGTVALVLGAMWVWKARQHRDA